MRHKTSTGQLQCAFIMCLIVSC